MNNIQIFKNEQFGQVRIAMTEGNEPMFCLADVAKALGYANPAKAVIDHCKGVTVLETPTSSGVQSIKFGKEGEVYRLTMKSKLSDAEKFQDWVCDEVLPSIRKNGIYATEVTIEKMVSDPDFAIQLLTNLKEEKQKRIKAEQANQKNVPKVLFADAVSTSQRSCLVAELAKILQQNGVNIGQNRLFQWLRKNSYLCNKGEYYNQPSQKAMELGLFEIKKTSIAKPDGSVLVTATTKVTGKGQIYFVNKFLGEKNSMKTSRYYTRCEDIPLCKFVRVYKGDFTALIIEGEAGNQELTDAAHRLIEEYSNIVGNKNMSFEIDRRSKMVNYHIKLNILDIATNLLDIKMYEEAKVLLHPLGIRISDDYSNLQPIHKSIMSVRAEIKLRLEMMKRQITEKPKGEIDFVKERMIVSSHFKIYINPKVYTAAEYGCLVKMMLDELKETRNGK